MLRRLVRLAPVVLVLAACVDTLPQPDGRFGTVTAPAFDAGAGTYVLKIEAAFYDNTDVGYTSFPGDTCVLAPYTTAPTVIGGSIRFLDAGERLLSSIGGRIDTLLPVVGLPVKIYRQTRANGIPYTPGDTLQITVPGAAFPASAVSVRTAEDFTHSEITVPAAGAALPLTWTAAPIGGSQMTFSLRYANAFATAGQNEQVFCSFVDDGTASIPSVYLDGWRSALNNDRSSMVTRVRAREVVIDAKTRISLLSTFSRPMNTLVQ